MNFALAGAILGFVGVAAGGFGAHGLRGSLAPDRLEIFETAVRYQLVHALVLLAVPALAAPRAGWAFLGGTLIFSGSLYLLVLTDRPWLGAVTPIGGLLLLVGWLLLALGLRRAFRRNRRVERHPAVRLAPAAFRGEAVLLRDEVLEPPDAGGPGLEGRRAARRRGKVHRGRRHPRRRDALVDNDLVLPLGCARDRPIAQGEGGRGAARRTDHHGSRDDGERTAT